eukprot:TRINITY_DN75935_c0_g1_i1.p1 TRINITY_DN75935_c0_g1~~TRINITY_DN75935_c0_g1_i1.p1  ORF type:complete len:571 (-),score=68.23 TRINITY_DN75935_c0_g1_i1:651-2312(-)
MDGTWQDDAAMLHSMFPACTLALLREMLRQHKGHVKRVVRALRADAKRKTKAELSVAIVGGGIGGFALALALQHHGIRCQVFERDSHFDERRQGYGLTMQQGTAALRTLGFSIDAGDNLGVHSTRHVVLTSEGLQVGEWGQRKWGRTEGKQKASRSNFHLPRQTLRKLLLDALRPGTVVWGASFVQYSKLPREVRMLRALTMSPNFNFGYGNKCDVESLELPPALSEQETDKQLSSSEISHGRGRDARTRSDDFSAGPTEQCMDMYKVSFRTADGSTVDYMAHVVVGCDGLNGSVRKQLTSDDDASPLRYLGVLVVLGIVDNLPAGTAGAEIVDGRTAFQMSDSTARLFGMPFDEGRAMWQLSWPMDEAAARTLARKGGAALKEEALRRCGAWAAPIPQLLLATEPSLVSGWPVSDRPPVTSKCFEGEGINERMAVTLLGDSAHPMSPFKGQGANQALIDAVVLARELSQCTSQGPLAALRSYEAEMMSRTATKVTASREAASFLHSELAVGVGDMSRAGLAKQERELRCKTAQHVQHAVGNTASLGAPLTIS